MKKHAFTDGLLALSLLLLTSLACSAGPLSGLFATATPTATNTPTSTPTSTPTLTPTATATPTITPTAIPTGTNKESLDDGATLFTDYDGRFQITFPADWKVIRLEASEIEEMLGKAVETNPQMQGMADALKKMDKNIFRAFVFDTQLEHLHKSQITNLTIAVPQETIFKSMPPAFLAGALAEALPQQTPGLKVLSDGFDTTANGIEFGYIESQYTVKDLNGNNITALQKMVIFEIPDGSAILTFTTPIDLKEKTLPIFEAILETIQWLDK